MDAMQLQVLSALTRRAALASRMGKSFGTKRDLFEELGYPLELYWEDYYARYERGDIAKRIVNAYPDATWRRVPDIVEAEKSDPGTETAFEKQWKNLTRDTNVWHYIAKADRLSGVGRYGVLFLGFDGSTDLKTPVTRASRLLYLTPYMETNASIHSYVTSTTDPNYGMPEIYKLKTDVPVADSATRQQDLLVHRSRVLHIAEGTEQNDIYGTPRLKAVWNRLMNLDLLLGGSAEMFWRGAFPGYGFSLSPEAGELTPDEKEDFDDQVEEYIHGMRRYLRTRGVDIEQLTPQLADPSNHVDIQLDMISGTTGIPKRILTGSEQGKLASTQDESHWLARVDERRTHYAEPMILRPFIDRLIEVGILPKPQNGYIVKWRDIEALSEQDLATIGETYARALMNYANAPLASQIVAPEVFLTKFMHLSPEEAAEAMAALDRGLAEETIEKDEEDEFEFE